MKLKLCEIVTKVDVIDRLTDDLSLFLDKIGMIKDYAFIVHDKDKRDTGEIKDAHYHIVIRLKDSYDTKHICQWFNIGENFIGKCKGRFSDMLKYLTHENSPSKFQYDDNSVISNYDWKEERNKSTSGRNAIKEEIIKKIVLGEIREYNYYEHISVVEYDKYKKSIDNAFKYRIDMIKGVAREMDCVFITGDSGTGKTSYAKKIAEEKGYSVFVSSGSNDPLDDYKGQDCIILDDLRPSCMGLSDLLKMLDNHTASTVKSRYKNKVLECKMIIITTTLGIDNFFNNVFSEERETVIQLKRRCNVMLTFEMDYIHNYMWQNRSRKYVYVGKLPNPITLERNVEDMTREARLSKLAEILGLSKDMIETVRDNDLEEVKGSQIEW